MLQIHWIPSLENWGINRNFCHKRPSKATKNNHQKKWPQNDTKKTPRMVGECGNNKRK